MTRRELAVVPVAITPGELSKLGQILSFREILTMPSLDDRRAAMVDHLFAIRDLALARTRISKNGDEFADPDSTAAVRCVEVACRLMGLDAAPLMPKGAGIALAAVFAAAGELGETR